SYRISYHERPHAPALHVFAARRGGGEMPVVVGPDGVWAGARAILNGFDAKSRPSQRLYGEEDGERSANRARVERLLALLLPAVRRYMLAQLLPRKRVLYPMVVDRAPLWERAVVYLIYPLWRRLLARRLNLTGGI